MFLLGTWPAEEPHNGTHNRRVTCHRCEKKVGNIFQDDFSPSSLGVISSMFHSNMPTKDSKEDVFFPNSNSVWGQQYKSSPQNLTHQVKCCWGILCAYFQNSNGKSKHLPGTDGDFPASYASLPLGYL